MPTAPASMAHNDRCAYAAEWGCHYILSLRQQQQQQQTLPPEASPLPLSLSLGLPLALAPSLSSSSSLATMPQGSPPLRGFLPACSPPGLHPPPAPAEWTGSASAEPGYGVACFGFDTPSPDDVALERRANTRLGAVAHAAASGHSGRPALPAMKRLVHEDATAHMSKQQLAEIQALPQTEFFAELHAERARLEADQRIRDREEAAARAPPMALPGLLVTGLHRDGAAVILRAIGARAAAQEVTSGSEADEPRPQRAAMAQTPKGAPKDRPSASCRPPPDYHNRHTAQPSSGKEARYRQRKERLGNRGRGRGRGGPAPQPQPPPEEPSRPAEAASMILAPFGLFPLPATGPLAALYVPHAAAYLQGPAPSVPGARLAYRAARPTTSQQTVRIPLLGPAEMLARRLRELNLGPDAPPRDADGPSGYMRQQITTTAVPGAHGALLLSALRWAVLAAPLLAPPDLAGHAVPFPLGLSESWKRTMRLWTLAGYLWSVPVWGAFSRGVDALNATTRGACLAHSAHQVRLAACGPTPEEEPTQAPGGGPEDGEASVHAGYQGCCLASLATAAAAAATPTNLAAAQQRPRKGAPESLPALPQLVRLYAHARQEEAGRPAPVRLLVAELRTPRRPPPPAPGAPLAASRSASAHRKGPTPQEVAAASAARAAERQAGPKGPLKWVPPVAPAPAPAPAPSEPHGQGDEEEDLLAMMGGGTTRLGSAGAGGGSLFRAPSPPPAAVSSEAAEGTANERPAEDADDDHVEGRDDGTPVYTMGARPSPSHPAAARPDEDEVEVTGFLLSGSLLGPAGEPLSASASSPSPAPASAATGQPPTTQWPAWPVPLVALPLGAPCHIVPRTMRVLPPEGPEGGASGDAAALPLRVTCRVRGLPSVSRTSKSNPWEQCMTLVSELPALSLSMAAELPAAPTVMARFVTVECVLVPPAAPTPGRSLADQLCEGMPLWVQSAVHPMPVEGTIRGAIRNLAPTSALAKNGTARLLDIVLSAPLCTEVAQPFDDFLTRQANSQETESRRFARLVLMSDQLPLTSGLPKPAKGRPIGERVPTRATGTMRLLGFAVVVKAHQ
ncbi:hypothetical protein PAPYR_5364 [Paratrimastix pyriformis]|uniref:Uncharacterized protein n=1 Tax=Paratrimastix pyriformis TaxID=342808 RepID=A0ABQ8UMA5_9EUKA|nr:hypothetical protein PAPYR_5364 [Paratrimastix pyriformis]